MKTNGISSKLVHHAVQTSNTHYKRTTITAAAKDYEIYPYKATVTVNTSEGVKTFELDNICSELKIKKSALIRYLLENFLDKYERAKGYE